MNNILFYSDKCQFSQTFIKKLNEEIELSSKDNNQSRNIMLKSIKLVNISTLKKIPEQITTIPTIIVENINVPLSGLDAFSWLDNSKFFYQQTNNIKNNIRHLNIVNDTTHVTNINSINKNSFANLKDEDDDKETNMKYNGAKENKLILRPTLVGTETDERCSSVFPKVDSVLKDTIDKKEDKANVEIQNKNVNNLIMQRKYQMQQFINSNKKR
jgi:hypothetical protein